MLVVLMTLEVLTTGLSIEQVSKNECGSSINNANCIDHHHHHQQQQHSKDFALSDLHKSNTKTNINNGAPVDLNNNNKKQDSQQSAPFILPFP